jgi:hypothetical protein
VNVLKHQRNDVDYDQWSVHGIEISPVDFMKVPVNFSLGSSLAAPKAMEFTRVVGMAVRILAAPLAAKNFIFSLSTSRSISK